MRIESAPEVTRAERTSMERLHYYTNDGFGMHRITEEEAKQIEERNREIIHGSPENKEQVQVVICVKAE